jgi:hypothetical protein
MTPIEDYGVRPRGAGGGLRYPVLTTAARTARDSDGRGRPEREQDGTPQ